MVKYSPDVLSGFIIASKYIWYCYYLYTKFQENLLRTDCYRKKQTYKQFFSFCTCLHKMGQKTLWDKMMVVKSYANSPLETATTFHPFFWFHQTPRNSMEGSEASGEIIDFYINKISNRKTMKFYFNKKIFRTFS